MFPALLAHIQEALHKRHLVYFVRVLSIETYAIRVIPSVVYATPPEDEEVMLETCRCP
jgi:hypothetical protein